jgi:uncharacterized peroxidase-related enzyme
MAHIDLPAGLPGIVGPMTAYPESGKALNALAEVLLRGPSPLSSAERELIATWVSKRNQCTFCANTHAAVARSLYGDACGVVDRVLEDADTAPLGEKMQALLAIADRVREDGRLVGEGDVARARAAGADDRTIHDTVLIAAAFCMFNRYVDGLGAYGCGDVSPDGSDARGHRLRRRARLARYGGGPRFVRRR